MEKRFRQSYSIAELMFELQSDIEISCNEEFTDFIQSGKADYQICIGKAEGAERIKGMLIARESGFNVYKLDEGLLYEYMDVNGNPYAFGRVDLDQSRVTVKYLHNALKHISHSRGAFFHIRWEELLLDKKRLILHACCVETFYGGILFSGVSGIGKSTQGNLWCQYEDAKLINGDRPILYKKENGWHAYGSPYAGSSHCHVNQNTKVRVIVLPEQEKMCAIRKLEKVEAFRKIFSQLTLAAWNPDSIGRACDIVESLLDNIPVYEMRCTPDKRAVDLLKQTIEEEVSR